MGIFGGFVILYTILGIEGFLRHSITRIRTAALFSIFIKPCDKMPRSAVVAGVALAAFAAGAAFVVAPTRAPTAPLPQGS